MSNRFLSSISLSSSLLLSLCGTASSYTNFHFYIRNRGIHRMHLIPFFLHEHRLFEQGASDDILQLQRIKVKTSGGAGSLVVVIGK